MAKNERQFDEWQQERLIAAADRIEELETTYVTVKNFSTDELIDESKRRMK